MTCTLRIAGQLVPVDTHWALSLSLSLLRGFMNSRPPRAGCVLVLCLPIKVTLSVKRGAGRFASADSVIRGRLNGDRSLLLLNLVSRLCYLNRLARQHADHDLCQASCSLPTICCEMPGADAAANCRGQRSVTCQATTGRVARCAPVPPWRSRTRRWRAPYLGIDYYPM